MSELCAKLVNASWWMYIFVCRWTPLHLVKIGQSELQLLWAETFDFVRYEFYYRQMRETLFLWSIFPCYAKISQTSACWSVWMPGSCNWKAAYRSAGVLLRGCHILESLQETSNSPSSFEPHQPKYVQPCVTIPFFPLLITHVIAFLLLFARSVVSRQIYAKL